MRIIHLTATALLLLFVPSALAQSPTSKARKIDIDTGSNMLQILTEEVQKNFYDPAFHQVNLSAKFEAAKQKLPSSQTLGQVLGTVAQPLLDLNEQHTFFVPPPRGARIDYGFQVQMIGDRSFVTAVAPFSDAEKKGLQVGDEVLSFNGFRLTRGNLWKLIYINYILRPGETPNLVVQKPGGGEKKIQPKPKVMLNQTVLKYDSNSDGRIDTKNLVNWFIDEVRMRKNRFADLSPEVVAWKMPHFDFDDNTLHGLVGNIRNKKALVLDLRENVGGRDRILEKLAGYLFDKPVTIAQFQGRKQWEPLKAETQGDLFKGNLVVIIDSKSSGAAELLARVVQLEKRGVVIGDVSAGATMKARLYRYDLGETPFAASISEGAAIMSDGKCLEYQGVTPDELVFPTPEDLAAGRDPVLARAAAILGTQVDPTKAGTLFPTEWHRDMLKE